MKMKRAKKEQQRSAHNAHQPKQQNPNKNKNVRKSLQNINNGKRFEKKKNINNNDIYERVKGRRRRS